MKIEVHYMNSPFLSDVYSLDEFAEEYKEWDLDKMPLFWVEDLPLLDLFLGEMLIRNLTIDLINIENPQKVNWGLKIFRK